MNIKKTLLYSSSLTLLIIQASRADVVIVGDGLIELDCSTDFEGGDLDGWMQARVFTPTASWEATSSLANTGNFSAAVDGNNELRRDFTEFANEIDAAGPDVDGFQIDELSFSARHPQTTATNLLFTAFYNDGSQADTNFVTMSSDWEMFDATDFVNDNSNGNVLTGVSFFGNNSGPTFVDDITIFGSAELIPEPASASLLLLGAAALLRRRRR